MAFLLFTTRGSVMGWNLEMYGETTLLVDKKQAAIINS